MNSILNMFANSPLKTIYKHSVKVTECCSYLIPFFEGTFKGDWQTSDELRLKIAKTEQEADLLKRDIRLKLPRGLFLPIARIDLLELTTQQDKLANYARDIAGLMVGRRCPYPQETQEKFMQYVKRSLDSTVQANLVITKLDNLLETGFKGRELILVGELINQLDEIEDDTDQMQIELRRIMHDIEQKYNPIDMMFLYKILELVGDLADQAQRVGSRIELMLARA